MKRNEKAGAFSNRLKKRLLSLFYASYKLQLPFVGSLCLILAAKGMITIMPLGYLCEW